MQAFWALVLGDHSAKTFEPLWAIVGPWQCYFYATDGWSVYPRFIPPGDQIVSKTYMTRGRRGEYTVAALSSKTTSQNTLLFQVRGNAEAFNSLVTALSKILGCPSPYLIHPAFQQRQKSLSVKYSTVIPTVPFY